MLTLDEILKKADEITLELQENSITPPRVGELLSSITEQLRLLSSGGTLIGASKLSELSDVMLLNEKENDILQRIGTKWTNVAMTNYATLSYTNIELAKKVDKTVLDDMFVKVNIGTAELPVWAIKTTYDFFSEKEISAYGNGVSGTGGGTTPIADDLISPFANVALSANMGVYLKSLIDAKPDNDTIYSHPTYTAATSGLYKVTVDTLGHISAATAVEKSDITALGIPAQDTTYSAATATTLGLVKIGAGVTITNGVISVSTAYDASGTTSAAMTAHLNAFAHGNIANGQTAFGWGNHASAGYALNSALSAHIGSNGTAHGLATASVNGFLSSTDFTKLSGIAVGANNYTHPATHAPSIIAQDANNRFVTDANIATWNAKANGTHTHYKSDIIDFAHTHSFSEIGITGLSTNYLTKYNGSSLVNSKIYDNGTNVGIGTAVPTEKVEIFGSAFINNGSLYIGSKLSRMSTNLTTGSYDFNYNTGATGQLAFYGGGTTSVWNVDALGNGYFSGNVGIGTATPTATLDVNGIGKFKDDILMTFNTWTHATDKNSLKKFLGLFDIDTAGNLVVKTNLYSTGEVTAYSSGTGVSGLTLMGNLNANNYDIYSVKSLSAGDIKFGYVGAKMGLHEELIGTTIAAFDENDYNYYFADNKLIYDNANNIFSVTGQVNATEFKFGNYSFKQSANGLSICYNGVEQAYITNTGQYVNS